MVKKIFFKFILFVVLVSILSPALYSQIVVYERQTTDELINEGLYYKSDTRKKIDLNGNWSLSFDEGKSFSDYMVPIAYDYKGVVIYKKGFSIPHDIIKYYSFILIAEGINYKANIKINNVFIIKHEGGFSSIKIPIDENIIQNHNEIIIDVDSELDCRNTIPLSNQINFSKNYGGITKDIYLLAVPKLYIFDNELDYKIESKYTVNVSNKCRINSGNISHLTNNDSNEFFLKTFLINNVTRETILESDVVKFAINNFNTKEVVSKFVLKDPTFWSPDNPELYLVRTIISDAKSLIDENYSELGITDVRFEKDFVSVNGMPTILKGINYYEYTPRYASALDYKDTERDLLNIKELGFNCIRVPGRTAHPYIVNICNRIGLFLFQEIPFNEVPEKVLRKKEYTQKAFDYLKSIIDRDKNSVSIIAWGIGNNFDVTCIDGRNYVKNAKEIINSIDERPAYYTTRNIDDDICSEFIDLKGINFFTNNSESVKSLTNDLKRKINQKKKGKPLLFVSSYGINVCNENSNGFSNIHSIEAQTKFLVDTYNIFSKTFFGNFISSYADWVSERPVNFPQNANLFLKTEGIYDIYRTPKQSAGFVSRVLNDQEISRISEGTSENSESYIFVISGVIVIIIFIIISSYIKKFKESLSKCIIRPNYFFQFVKEQMLISVFQNIMLSLTISFGIALYLSALFYFYRESNIFDMLIANTFSSDYVKIIISYYINEPYKSIIFFTILIFLLQLLTAFIIYFISMFRRGTTYFKNVYTIAVWTAIPLLIFLPIGTVIVKLASINIDYITFSLILFALAYLIYIVRLISGTRIILDLSKFKAYVYGIFIIIIVHCVLFSYLYFYKSTISILDLILSYA